MPKVPVRGVTEDGDSFFALLKFFFKSALVKLTKKLQLVILSVDWNIAFMSCDVSIEMSIRMFY
jgi:hypothetical protein